MNSALTVSVLGFLTLGAALNSALAATASGSFGVSATVPASCLASASSLQVGTYSGAAMNATYNVSMNCTDATPYNVSLAAARVPGPVAVSPKMTALGLFLHGHVLASNNRESASPVHEVGSDSVAGAGSGAPQTITVRGQIPAGHSIAAGDYPDSIAVTVTY